MGSIVDSSTFVHSLKSSSDAALSNDGQKSNDKPSRMNPQTLMILLKTRQDLP